MICDMLIVGGDGDLAYRKLYPALYHLDMANCLPACLRVVCVSRVQQGIEQFRVKVAETLAVNLQPGEFQQPVWERFSARLHSYSLDATNEAELRVLSREIFTDKNRELICYLATPPSIFAPVCQSLWAVGLVRDNMRLVIEKPLGHDRQSFLEINDSLMAIFQEHQVYRIDHYLGKETVQNLLTLRFANALFEPLWNNTYIDHVQITAAESAGVGGRWSFYDDAGALRDMVQNHMLQLLCLLAMEPPASLEPRAVHDEKLKVLRSLAPIKDRAVARYTVRGQYDSGSVNGHGVPAYTAEAGANARSSTETFVAIKAHINNWRWAGVPFYLRTGKRLQRRYCEIVVQFKELSHSLFQEQSGRDAANRLVIQLHPDEGIRLNLLNKVPGLDESFSLETVSLNLSLSEAFTERHVPKAYERLLYDVMRGNSTLFMRADLVEEAWKWIDDIRQGWESTKLKTALYQSGSTGPTDSIALIARDDRRWLD